jgi:hypothetical protein
VEHDVHPVSTPDPYSKIGKRKGRFSEKAEYFDENWLHSQGECSRFLPNAPVSDQIDPYAFISECVKGECASGGLLFTLTLF